MLLHTGRDGDFGRIRTRFHDIGFNGGLHAPQVLQDIFDIIVKESMSFFNEDAIIINQEHDAEEQDDNEAVDKAGITEGDDVAEEAANRPRKNIPY